MLRGNIGYRGGPRRPSRLIEGKEPRRAVIVGSANAMGLAQNLELVESSRRPRAWRLPGGGVIRGDDVLVAWARKRLCYVQIREGLS